MSNRNTVLENVMHDLTLRRSEIELILPPDLSFARFHATIHQALRNYPAILDCQPQSIVNACVKAAYDGLRIDGREAAIVEREIKIKKGVNQGKTFKVAHYFPMAFGLIQQIYRGGEIIAMEVEVVRENDKYLVMRGTDPKILHEPNLESDRGKIIAAYSVATFKTGAKTFEVMDRADLAAVRASAEYDGVWKKWEGEMSKKSVVRRHRKMLPLGDRDIVDVEASDLYPQFADNAPTAIPHRPRPSRAAISDQSGTEAGASLEDLEDEREVVTIDANERLTNDTSKEGENLKRSADSGNDDRNMSENMSIPSTGEEWALWEKDILAKITDAPDDEALTSLEMGSIAGVIDNADGAIASNIRMALTEKRTDLAMEADNA